MKIILTLLFFFNFFVLSSKEVSKETCNIIKELVKNQIITLEKKSEKINYSGIKFEFSEKDGSAEILTIHPELRKEIWEKEWDISIFDYIEEINNIKVSELNEENFADEVSKSEINIKIFDVEKVYKISSKDYYELPVYFSYSFRNIKNIDTKNSSFDASFSLEYLYEEKVSIEDVDEYFEDKLDFFDTKLASLECDISEEDDQSFYDLGFKILNFVSTGIEKKPTVTITYTPFYYCEKDFNYCKNNKSKYQGALIVSNKKEYTGSISQVFPLDKFPFDVQTVELSIYNPNLYVSPSKKILDYDMYFSDENDNESERYLYDAVNSEWEFYDYDYMTGDYYNALNKTKNQTLGVLFFIERLSNYYILKLILPIVLILIIAMSVYWINTKDLESRVTVSIVCLLSLIAYNFIIDEDLPKLGYLTFLDEFIIISYVFAGIPTIQSILSKYLLENNKVSLSVYIDYYARFYLPLCYVLSVLYIIYLNDII